MIERSHSARARSARRTDVAAALIVAAAFVASCANELPRRSPRPPAADAVAEIVVVDAAGAVTAVIQSPETIARVLGSWAFSSSDWRAPWLVAPQPAYWVELHAANADVETPPVVYGLGVAGSAWWLSFGADEIRFMKGLPAVEQRELLADLEIPVGAR